MEYEAIKKELNLSSSSEDEDMEYVVPSFIKLQDFLGSLLREC